MDQAPFVPSPKLRKLQRANRKREALGAGGLVQLHALQEKTQLINQTVDQGTKACKIAMKRKPYVASVLRFLSRTIR